MTGTGKATIELELPCGPHPWGRRFQGREEVRGGAYWKLVER
jgi:hypothetical protein